MPTMCVTFVLPLSSSSAVIAFGGKRREEETGRRRGVESPQPNQRLSVSRQEHEDWGICTPLWRCMVTGREGPPLCLSCRASNSITTANYLGDAAFQSF